MSLPKLLRAGLITVSGPRAVRPPPAPGFNAAAEADWNARLNDPGVVAHHAFEAAAEVSQFRWATSYGNSPDAATQRTANCAYEEDAGVGFGGCVAITRDGVATSMGESAHWIRPWAALTGATNGRGTDDPAKNGELTLRTLPTPVEATDTLQNFAYGWWGHPTYVAADPTHFEGGPDIYMVYRTKRDSVRWTGGDNAYSVGKHMFVGYSEGSDGEFGHCFVFYSYGGGGPSNNYFRMYGGINPNSPTDNYPSYTGDNQPGGITQLFAWGADSWDSIMFHLTLGRTSVVETRLELWYAHTGEYRWTKFYDLTIPLYDGSPGFYNRRNGLQTTQFSTYNNNSDLPDAFTDRMTQWMITTNPPAPPQINADGTGTALAVACHAMSEGDDVDFTELVGPFAQADLEWQTKFVHDPLHQIVHLFGKPAGDDTGWQHVIYDCVTDTVSDVTSSTGMDAWSYPGHLYGGPALDPTTGDVYVCHAGMNSTSGHNRQIGWWQYPDDNDFANAQWGWSPVTAGNMYQGAFDSTDNGVGYHPHLYGRNDGGWYLDSNSNIVYWRKSTDATDRVGHTAGLYGTYYAEAIYWPAQNCLIAGGASGKTLIRVDPNTTAGARPVITTLAVPPIRVEGNSKDNLDHFGSIHVHPGDPNKLLIVETSAGQRAWTSSDGVSWDQIADHPFSLEPRVVCSLGGGLGCMWGIAKSGSSTTLTKLWKPETA